MYAIKNDAFLGTTEKFNQKLELLAKLAQPEMWTYKNLFFNKGKIYGKFMKNQHKMTGKY